MNKLTVKICLLIVAVFACTVSFAHESASSKGVDVSEIAALILTFVAIALASLSFIYLLKEFKFEKEILKLSRLKAQFEIESRVNVLIYRIKEELIDELNAIKPRLNQADRESNAQVIRKTSERLHARLLEIYEVSDSGELLDILAQCGNTFRLGIGANPKRTYAEILVLLARHIWIRRDLLSVKNLDAPAIKNYWSCIDLLENHAYTNTGISKSEFQRRVRERLESN